MIFVFQDTWVDDRGDIFVDTQQDCQEFDISYQKNRAKFTFIRKFDTCDDDDYIIEVETSSLFVGFFNINLS